MLSKVHHVGIVVKSADEALKFYRDTLGLAVSGDRVIEDQGVRGVLLPMGESEIELLEPTRDDTGVAKFLASGGEGIHHICFESDDVGQELKDAEAKGCELLDKVPRAGLAGMIGFIHPKSNHGTLIEFATPVEPPHHAEPVTHPPVSFNRIDHIAIAVQDLDTAINTFGSHFGLKPGRSGDAPSIGIRYAMLPIGDCEIELAQPTTEEGPFARFVKERREGPFSIIVEVSDKAAAAEYLKSKGAEDGESIGPYHGVAPASTHGVNIQLMQKRS